MKPYLFKHSEDTNLLRTTVEICDQSLYHETAIKKCTCVSRHI